LLQSRGINKGQWVNKVHDKDVWVMGWKGELLFDKPYKMSNIMKKEDNFVIKKMNKYEKKK
jgi:hypothetical protein